MQPQIEIHSESSLSSIQRTEQEKWFSKEFGHTSYQWATPDWYILASIDTAVVCRLGIVERIVFVNEHSIPVAGISGVITRSEWRGRKLASLVLNEAREFMENKLDVDFGLLLCRQEVTPVYAKLGWKAVDGPTTFSQPTGQMRYLHKTMVLKCGQKSWPPGPIYLCGLPW
jgi:aminoglycoside 2'-N-acetyltransferase I